MSTWLVAEGDLTPEQIRAVRLDPTEHRVIFGAPGSGKTMVLLHRAKYLSRMQRVAPAQFHFFVFTEVLKAYIRSALILLDIPRVCVSNFDSWCASFHKNVLRRPLPWNASQEAPDFHGARVSVLAWLRRQPRDTKLFDFVLVDEGQDLDGVAFEILTRIAWHVTVCMDPKQQIFEGGSSEADVLKALGLKKRNMSLLEAYRCTPYIVKVASRFIGEEADRKVYLRQVRVPQVERETPLLFLAEDTEAETRRLADLIRVRQTLGDRVGILLAHRDQVLRHGGDLARAGLEVEVPPKMARACRTAPIDFASDRPKMMPFPSAKGLTFDSVLMPDLNGENFASLSEARIRKLLFVGSTRATRWLYFSALKGKGPPLLPLFEELAEGGDLTIQDGVKGAPGPQKPNRVPPKRSGPGGVSDWF